jgi:RNA polymerase sigma factor (sigma-70 family)
VARRRDIARADLRIDLSPIGAARARELLDRYGRLIDQIARDFPAADRDDLRSAGRIGVLEAALTHDPRKAPESQWVGYIVRQRVRAVARSNRLWQHARTETAVDPLTNGRHDPEGLMLRRAMLKCIGLLPPRESVILSARLRGETFEEIATACGISVSNAQRAAERGLARIRHWVRTGLS